MISLNLVDYFALIDNKCTPLDFSVLIKKSKRRLKRKFYSMAESFKSSSFSGVGGEPVGNPVMFDDCGKLTGAGPNC